jgi:alanine racemase
MTLTLRVDEPRWRRHVHCVAARYDELVPVVKGNGYGFGRAALTAIAAELLAGHRSRPPTIAVGTVHELAGLPDGIEVLVLTPVVERHAGLLPDPAVAPAIATIATIRDVAALGGWPGRAVVKLESSMHRFGVAPGDVAAVVAAAEAADLTIEGYALHLAFAGTDDDRRAEVDGWLAVLAAAGLAPPSLWLGHLAPTTVAALRVEHPGWTFPVRVGTELWHGDKSALQLVADVAVTRPVRHGEPAGYRATPVPADGTLVVVGAGSAHGVVPLDDGRSPFHFRRQRLALLERPHMHTTTLFVPDGATCPRVGDAVDVQRPLIAAHADEVRWEPS